MGIDNVCIHIHTHTQKYKAWATFINDGSIDIFKVIIGIFLVKILIVPLLIFNILNLISTWNLVLIKNVLLRPRIVLRCILGRGGWNAQSIKRSVGVR